MARPSVDPGDGATKPGDSSSKLARLFVERVSEIGAVNAVLLVRSEAGLTVWTVLDREPRNRELRYRIYGFEQDILRLFPEIWVDFRLINLSEFADPDSLHLPRHEVLYEREAKAGAGH